MPFLAATVAVLVVANVWAWIVLVHLRLKQNELIGVVNEHTRVLLDEAQE
jgi:hypothetical protein